MKRLAYKGHCWSTRVREQFSPLVSTNKPFGEPATVGPYEDSSSGLGLGSDYRPFKGSLRSRAAALARRLRFVATPKEPGDGRYHPAAASVTRDSAVSDRCACGVALKTRLGHAYNEEAFHYLLTLERTRSERSGRSLLLLLVDLNEQPAVSAPIDPTIARKVFSSLWLSLRETDVIGWYRYERVVGAVLPEFRDAPGVEASPRLLRRVHAVLCERLSKDVARRLHVRVDQHPAPEKIDSASPQITGAELLMGEI